MKGKLIFERGKRPKLVFGNDSEVEATDAATTLAQDELGMNAEAFLASIEGTGKNGKITLRDVRAALTLGEG